jgi:hypothetical protein
MERNLNQFLAWYNRQSGKNYICKRGGEFFSGPVFNPAWDFALYEPDNPGKWIALAFGELAITPDVRQCFEFWQGLCADIGRDLKMRGIIGEFGVYMPKFLFGPGEITRLRQAIIESIIEKQKILDINRFADIGGNVQGKFPGWPTSKSVDMIEFHQWGTFGRPDELLVQKFYGIADSISVLVNPNEVFRMDAGTIPANTALGQAREKGAGKTILLLVGDSAVDGQLVKSALRVLHKQAISNIDEMDLIDSSDSKILRIM